MTKKTLSLSILLLFSVAKTFASVEHHANPNNALSKQGNCLVNFLNKLRSACNQTIDDWGTKYNTDTYYTTENNGSLKEIACDLLQPVKVVFWKLNKIAAAPYIDEQTGDFLFGPQKNKQ